MRHFFYLTIVAMIFSVTLISCNEKDDQLFTVSFNSNGGSAVMPQTVKAGGKVTRPNDPTRDRYAFVAWYKYEWLINEWKFDIDMVTADTTLYAMWEQAMCTVTFYCNEGCEIPPQTVKTGEKITEPSPAPTREGYSFDGWYLYSGTVNKWDFATQTVDYDIILYAKWIADEEIAGIEGISFENYPKVDGSTSSSPLNRMVACKLLGIRYEWGPWGILFEWNVYPDPEDVPEKHENFFRERVKNSQTHGAFMNLIDGNVDIILTHRTVSPDEKAHADAVGVTLIETPIALDAFVFVVSASNPVKSLSVEQVRKIYTGEITNWSQVGGNNTEIKVFTRPRNSGSEEVFRSLVMKNLIPLDFPEWEINSMAGVFPEISYNVGSICYTFSNYKDLQVRVPDSRVPKIAINGIFPDGKTIKDRTYPFIPEVHVAIRSDLNRNTMAYKLYEWLQSEDAKSTISECGFIPK